MWRCRWKGHKSPVLKDERELSLRILLSQQIEVFQVLLTSAIIKYIFLHHQTFNKMQETSVDKLFLLPFLIKAVLQ